MPQSLGVALDHGRHQVSFRVRFESCQPNEQDAAVEKVLPDYQFAEILVRRQQNCVQFPAAREDDRVLDTRLRLGDEDYLVAVRSQQLNDSACRYSRRRRSSPSEFLQWVHDVGAQGLGGKGDCGTDILFR